MEFYVLYLGQQIKKTVAIAVERDTFSIFDNYQPLRNSSPAPQPIVMLPSQYQTFFNDYVRLVYRAETENLNINILLALLEPLLRAST
jgi:hypothetical protein